MPGLRRINVAGYPYLVTTRVNDGSSIFDDPENAEIVLSAIYHSRDKGKYYPLGFVIMPNHIHLLLQPRGEETMSSIMQSIKGYSSWLINRRYGKKGRVWQSGFYDYALETEEKLLRRMEYINGNPVRLGLVEEAPSYRYSSAYPGNSTDMGLFL